MTTVLVDGNAVSHTVDVNNCENEKTFAKYFFSRLREYAKLFPSMPKFVLFFDDKAGGNWREELYPDYQKTRKSLYNNSNEKQKAELELRSKYMAYLKKQLSSSNHMYLHYPHTEADDLIALYCKNLQQDNETVTILTTDKDLFQLIQDKGKKKVQVLFLIKRKLVKDAKLGKEVLENKIWLGDASDSIPGVCRNVGKVTYPDFRKFIDSMKEQDVDPTDKEKAKKVSESLKIKYTPSFSNFSQEQLDINTKLIDLSYVVERDKQNNNEKTNYIKENINRAKISPFALYSVKLV